MNSIHAKAMENESMYQAIPKRLAKSERRRVIGIGGDGCSGIDDSPTSDDELVEKLRDKSGFFAIIHACNANSFSLTF